MELWIRSQDRKTILKAYRIDVDDKNIIVWDNNYQCSETYMGEYKTKERALEILDEIQKQLEPHYIWIPVHQGDEKFYRWGIEREEDTIVYEMPKE